MTVKRNLIVNADDFGQSAGVNRGIIEAHERGIVTSASLMVRWPASAAAATYGRRRPALSLGLHIDLGEWTYRGESWVPVYEVVASNDRAAVAAEVNSQVETFRRLLGQDPTHIDSHQHVHRSEPVHSVVVEIARRLGVPLRDFTSRIRYCGDFYGQTATGDPYPEGISADKLIALLTALPPGVTELGCHPGEGSDVDSMYRSERALEVKTLCDPRIWPTIATEGIELHSFHEIIGIH
jgi:predicted glycoside hydrolase/deacetylase ChbG (UPF0249 family)